MKLLCLDLTRPFLVSKLVDTTPRVLENFGGIYVEYTGPCKVPSQSLRCSTLYTINLESSRLEDDGGLATRVKPEFLQVRSSRQQGMRFGGEEKEEVKWVSAF